MEAMGSHISDAATAASLADALVTLLQPGGTGSKKKGLDEGSTARALGALAALWRAMIQQQQQQEGEGGVAVASIEQQQPQEGEGGVAVAETQQQQQQDVAVADTKQQQQQEQLLRHWEALSLLTGKVNKRAARLQLATALGQLGQLLQPYDRRYSAVAAAVAGLNAWSTTALDEVDYEQRLQFYSRLQPGVWGSYNRLQGLPLVLQAFQDMRNAEDLTLRQAAAGALEKCAMALRDVDQQQQQQQSNAGQTLPAAVAEDGSGSSDSLLRLLPRVVYPQIKLGLRSGVLSVRQEHLGLLRNLVLLLPGRFSDLVWLVSEEADKDFFLNVSHLQVHRRGRALLWMARQLEQHQRQGEQQQGEQEVNEQQQQQGEQGGNHGQQQDQQQQGEQEGNEQQQQQGGQEGNQGQHQDQQQQGGQEEGYEQEGKQQKEGKGVEGERRGMEVKQQQQWQGGPSIRVLVDVILPLLQQFILEGGGGGEEGPHVKKQSEFDR